MKARRIDLSAKRMSAYVIALFMFVFFYYACFHCGAAIGDFIACSPLATIVRHFVFGLGCLTIGVALAIKTLHRRETPALMSDDAAVKYFAAALFLVPSSCFVFAATTRCDFLGFQVSSAIVLFLFGCHVALRAKRRRMVLVYIVELLLFGGWSPSL